MSVPGNVNSAPPPSSFDDQDEFYQESRFAKLKRRLVEEPLIPLGVVLTCWALVEAAKSIRAGDAQRTNRMFRRRIYAQGFTILAMVAGSAYWENDRKKRKEYDGLVDEKKKKEKQDAWIRELEIRDEEEREMRKARDQKIKDRVAERQKLQAEAAADISKTVRSVLEQSERSSGIILAAARDLWERRR